MLDDNRIEVYLDCGSGVVWDVDESPERVAVDVRMSHRPGDCSARAIIGLAEPLGDCPLVDATTGDEVAVGSR